MKNSIVLFITLVICIAFTSCSKNDNPTPSQDEIIGHWKIIEQTLGGENFTDECTFEKRYLYLSSGISELTDQSYEESLDACISSLVTGSWLNLGNGTYHFEYQDTQPADFHVVFSNNGNEMTFSTTLTFGNEELILEAVLQKL